jgi:hypothetical protein
MGNENGGQLEPTSTKSETLNLNELNETHSIESKDINLMQFDLKIKTILPLIM